MAPSSDDRTAPGADGPTALALQAYFSGSHLTAGAAVVAGGLVAWAFWSAENRAMLMLWLAGLASVAVLRSASSAAYQRRRSLLSSDAHWARVAFGVPILMGSVWGAGVAHLLGVGDDPQVMVLICVSLGAVMGSIGNAVFWPAHAAFLLPVMGGLSVGLVVHPRPESPALLGGALLITALIALQGRSLGRRLVRALELAQENRRLVQHLSEHSQALESANRDLARLSSTDALTGLANRRGWEAAWRSLRAMPAADVGLLVVDIDHFKHYNDTHGHAAGDVCIARVADVVRTHLPARPDAIASRLGGEEFGVLLPGLTEEAAARLGERIRVHVEGLHEAWPGLLQRRITVSVGLAHHRRDDGWPCDADALFREADHALYDAKHGGRNQVRRAERAAQALA